MAKSIVILLILATGICAKTLPSIPSDDLLPPPEDQESILIRFSQPEPLPPKSFFQRIVTWFGFNGEPLTQSSNVKSKQQAQKQTGYVYENPNKLQQQPQSQKQQSSGYHYEDPNKPLKLQSQPPTGYHYEAPKPFKLQNEPQTGGYHYDDPNKVQKIQNPPPTGYHYDPPPMKQQLQPQILLPQIVQPHLVPQPQLLSQQQTQFTGYHYDSPLKLQKPAKLNDLVSSAASPTAVYSYAVPPRPFSQAQSQATDNFAHPCNTVPWLPMFPSYEELELLRARLQAKQNAGSASGTYQNIQPIRQPEKFSLPNANGYLPPVSPSGRPLRQPSITSLTQTFNELPGRSTPQPFRSTNAEYPSPSVPSLSVTQIPPVYNARPFSQPAQTYGSTIPDTENVYINGKLITSGGGGSTTGSIHTIQSIYQTHPATQSFSQPSTAYGSPPVTSPAPIYGPPVSTLAPVYGPPVTTLAPIYGPPTNSYGAPPLKLTAGPDYFGSTLPRFTASQPFTPRSTLSPSDQSRESSSKVEHKSHFISSPIVIADGNNAPSTGQHSSTPIQQVLNQLNISSTPQGFQHTMTTASPADNTIASDGAVDELNQSNDEVKSSAGYMKKDINHQTGDRGTPLNLLDSPISHFRKTSVAPSSTTPQSVDEHVSNYPEFKYIKNTWTPLSPDGFTRPGLAPALQTTPAPFATVSASYQTTSSVRDNEATDDDRNKKPKKIQVIIPYTSKNHPSPFRQNAYQTFDTAAGWSHSNRHDDIHDSQESQVVSSATPSPNRIASLKRNNSRYLTKILAKNIRDLLKREHLKNLTTIDLEKLQKNIDGWTEQEFSMTPNRGSTISLLSQSKHIPSEYLTTTPALNDMTTTDSPSTYYEDASEGEGETSEDGEEADEAEDGDVDAAIEDESETDNDAFGPDNDAVDPDEEAIQQAEAVEDDDFKRLEYVKSLDNNQISGSETRLVYETTTRPPRRATTLPPCSTTQIVPIRTTVLPSPDELWNKLKSLLSPAARDRKEKVYVVTPQPHPYFESDESVTTYVHDNENEIAANFKSPRFLVRPTPGMARSSTGNIARVTLPRRGKRLG